MPANARHPQPASFDTVIIGGGVAALWTANELKQAGQSVLVLSRSALGEGQSLAAQGVIHGGLKYAVGGKLTDSSEALAGMPSRWLRALRGEGSVDLGGAEILSDHQVLWSLPNVVGRAVGFFGSKAVRGRAEAIPRDEYPSIFDTPEYRGRLFRIDEPVVDPVSVIRELARPVEDETYLVDWETNARLECGGGNIDGIVLKDRAGVETRVTAGTFVLAAGAGNGDLLSEIGAESPAMQRRPLHQLIVRKPGLPDFYSVCAGTGAKPPLVTTTHTDSRGRRIWYVGGDIAEQAGVERGEAEQIAAGKALFAKLLPWVDLSGAEWFTWRGDRAEPHTGTGDRPAGAFCRRIGNVLVAWPTKFALAPDLADRVLSETRASGKASAVSIDLPRPGIGTAPWDLP
ncbi:MAG: FAD-dependent oxidoreductase [Verrucomicrobiales bacterium]